MKKRFTKGVLNPICERLWAFVLERPVRKIFGYCRVSTSDQNYNLQKDSLLSAGVTDLFEETASGAQRYRKELKKIQDVAREGDRIVVWRLDRLARSLKQLAEVIEDLGECGIKFQSPQESIDTSTSGRKPAFGIFASLAELDRNSIWDAHMLALLLREYMDVLEDVPGLQQQPNCRKFQHFCWYCA